MCANAAILAGQCVDIFGYTEEAAYTTLNGDPAPATPGYDEGNYDFEARNDTDFWGSSVTLEWQLGNYTLKSITSYDEMEDFRPEETDDGPNDILTGELSVDQDTFSQEFRVSWEGPEYSWIAGAYYLNDEATDNTAFDVLRDFRPFFVGDDVSCTAPPGNPGGFCPEQSIFKTKSGTEQEITSFALYFDTTVSLTDQLNLSAGLRYTDEEIDHFSFFFFDEPEADFPA